MGKLHRRIISVENSITSTSVINILKNRISFLENELSKKVTIIDYLSNELITSERSRGKNVLSYVNIYIYIYIY